MVCWSSLISLISCFVCTDINFFHPAVLLFYPVRFQCVILSEYVYLVLVFFLYLSYQCILLFGQVYFVLLSFHYLTFLSCDCSCDNVPMLTLLLLSLPFLREIICFIFSTNVSGIATQYLQENCL